MNSIESNFVPYQIALDMKSIGFDEPCLGYYWIHDKELVLNLNTPFQGYHKGFNGSISAPTFSQCFRWFIDKYDLIGLVEGGYDNGKNIFTYVIWDKFKDNSIDVYYQTYEEAELECLVALIKSVL